MKSKTKEGGTLPLPCVGLPCASAWAAEGVPSWAEPLRSAAQRGRRGRLGFSSKLQTAWLRLRARAGRGAVSCPERRLRAARPRRGGLGCCTSPAGGGGSRTQGGRAADSCGQLGMHHRRRRQARLPRASRRSRYAATRTRALSRPRALAPARSRLHMFALFAPP